MYLLAGIVSAVLAYILNRVLVRRFGAGVIIFITPIVEEGLKTGLAILFRTLILPVHVFFGIIEGIYDLKTSRLGTTAGLLSVLWHTVFGLVTIMVQQIMGHIVYGLLAAIFLHYIGNSIVVKPKEDSE